MRIKQLLVTGTFSGILICHLLWGCHSQIDRSTETRFDDKAEADTHLARGKRLAVGGDLDGAIDLFSKFIKRHPDNARAYNDRGVVWLGKGNYHQAIEDFTKTIELNPYSAEAFNERGDCFIKINQIEKGCQDLMKACELKFCEGLNLAKERNLCQ